MEITKRMTEKEWEDGAVIWKLTIVSTWETDIDTLNKALFPT
jgi:hypothetical protein